MRDGARVQAAIEVLTDSNEHHRPPALSLRDWAVKHRFAGSKDRSAIGDIVFMALRVRALSEFVLEAETPRAWALGALKFGFGFEIEKIQGLAVENEHSFGGLELEEIEALSRPIPQNAPPPVIGNYPAWLDESLALVFGENRAVEMAAMAKPAPLDLRTNILKTNRDNLIAELSTSPKLMQKPDATDLSPWGIRIPWNNGKNFPWATEFSYLKGEFEVQDEASQLVSILTGAKEGMTIADVCAGAGGKTLALAMMTNNKATIIAYDKDQNRIAPIFERLTRAGVNNVDVRTLRRGGELDNLKSACEIVLVDAPCTGSGTWRRAPDTKWRISPQNIETRQLNQQEALALGAPLVKDGGVLVYATCSVLPQENDDTIGRFLEANSEFTIKPIEKHLEQLGFAHLLEKCHKTKYGIQFTPFKSNTDGFYFAVLEGK
jgi:16S rRNA (cytosine967-C5)-methyltransferase